MDFLPTWNLSCVGVYWSSGWHFPLKTFSVAFFTMSSKSSRQRTLTVYRLGSIRGLPKAWIPQCWQNQWLASCVPNWYKERLSWPSTRVKCSSWTVWCRMPFLRQTEQLQTDTWSMSASIWNTTALQWQLPLYVFMSSCLVLLCLNRFGYLLNQASLSGGTF